MSKHVVAYDICDPKRLRKVAKFWEARGLRVQKSVFLVDSGRKQLEEWFDELRSFISEDEDYICGWQVYGAASDAVQVGNCPLVEGETCILDESILSF